MRPKEVLDRFVHKDLTAKWADPVLKAVLLAMKEYAMQQVKTVPKKNVKHSYEVTLRPDDENVYYFTTVKAYDENDAMRIANLDTDMMAVKSERM
jgi:hypothetical protein